MIDAENLGGAVATDAADAKEVQAELPLEALPIVAPGSMAGSKVVVVPASVVLPRDGASFVAVVTGGDKATSKPASLTWRAVEIERQTAFDIQIKSGLRDGEQVVDQPILLLSLSKPETKQSVPVVVQTTS